MRAATLWAVTIALAALGCSADNTGPGRGSQPGIPLVYPTGGTSSSQVNRREREHSLLATLML